MTSLLLPCSAITRADSKPRSAVGTDRQAYQVRLMSPKKHQRLQRLLPRVDDPEVQALLDDDRLILYTEREMPKAYQDWDSGLPGVHSPSYNISANQGERFGNPNLEFPWNAPAGTHRTKNTSAFRFLWLPVDEDGKPLPVVWYRWHYPGDASRGYAWTFPVGAVVGEVLMLRDPNGQEHVFELRVRKREYGGWAVDVFRPFPTSQELADAIRAARPQWQEDADLAKLVEHLEQPITMKRHRIRDHHPQRSFAQFMGIDTLPPVGDDQLVSQLLTETTFRSALGVVWRHSDNGLYTCAPTTKAAFHVVPANYDAGFVEIDQESCMRCHETAGKHARRFDFGRDWYGRVRGSDGIFSFHPFARSSISPNGFGRSVSMRPELVEAKLLQKFNPAKHSRKIYQRLELPFNGPPDES